MSGIQTFKLHIIDPVVPDGFDIEVVFEIVLQAG